MWNLIDSLYFGQFMYLKCMSVSIPVDIIFCQGTTGWFSLIAKIGGKHFHLVLPSVASLDNSQVVKSKAVCKMKSTKRVGFIYF